MRRVTGAAGLAVGLWMAFGGVASAHIEPDPNEVTGGSTEMIRFVVEHGCDDSPTTRVTMELPDGVSDPVPLAPAGWAVTTSGKVITWSGGPQDPDEGLLLDVTMTFDNRDARLRFPIVQTCEEGELRWVEDTPENGPEPDYPAPLLTVKASGGTTPPDATVTTAAAPATTKKDEHEKHSGGKTDEQATDTVEGESGGLGTGAMVAIGVGAAAVVAAVVAAMRGRRHGSEGSDHSDG